MPKRSTPFQHLVSLIEKQLAPNVTVSESHFFLDRQTGEKREVDVALIGKIGDLPVIVSIEVNEKARPADVQWIERQYQKHQSLPTNKLILVSKSGFSEQAKTKAEKLGIDAITLEEVGSYHFGYGANEIENIRINFTLPMIYLLTGDERIFLTGLLLRCKRNGQEFEMGRFLFHWLDQVFDFKKFHDSVAPDFEQKFELSMPVTDHAITFRYFDKDYKLDRELKANGYLKKFSIPIVCSIGKYRTDHVITATSIGGTAGDFVVVLPKDGKKGHATFQGIEMELDGQIIGSSSFLVDTLGPD